VVVAAALVVSGPAPSSATLVATRRLVHVDVVPL
jgi:hypothetical protein